MKNLNEVGARFANKMALVNMTINDAEWVDNKRKNPFYSELAGMFQMLKAMEIDFSIDYDAEVKNMTAITIEGKRFEVK